MRPSRTTPGLRSGAAGLALSAVVALAPVRAAQGTDDGPVAETPAPDEEATLAAWREALELDLPAEVLADGPARVGPGGALERNGEAIALVAMALFDAGREDEAQALVDGARPTEETRAHVVIARAQLFLERDQLGAVVQLLRAPEGSELPVLYPEEPESWLLLGRAFARAGETQTADHLLAAFLQRAPRHREAAGAWHALAQHAITRRDLGTARAHRARAEAAAQWWSYYRARRLQIRERPDAPLPRLGLAKLWLAAGEPRRARDVLLALVTVAPDFCPGWAHLGEAQRLDGAAAAAREAYDRAVACDPDESEARLWRGLFATFERRDADARTDLEWIVAAPEREADPRFRDAHLALGRIAVRAGDEAGGRAHHERYRELGGREEP